MYTNYNLTWLQATDFATTSQVKRERKRKIHGIACAAAEQVNKTQFIEFHCEISRRFTISINDLAWHFYNRTQSS